MAGRDRVAHAPPVDADEQKQPDDVNEMPIPSRRFEAEMMIRLEMALRRAPQAHCEETSADDDVETVKAGSHEKGRRVDPVGEVEGGVAVFISLHRRKTEAEDHRYREAL